MKNILLILTFVLSSFFGHSQSTSKKQELIIYMPRVDKEKTLPDVINAVSIKGVHPVAFCNDIKCLLVEIDSDDPAQAELVITNLKNAGFEFDLKSDATIKKVMDESKEVLTATTSWQ
jgi:hypothetical protein